MIDAHVHVWDLADRPQPWTDEFPPLQRSFAVADLAPDLDPGDRIVVVQTVAEYGETLELLARAADDQRIAGVVGWLDLTRPVAPEIDVLRRVPGGRYLVGLRHQLQIEPDPNWLARTDVRDGLREMGEAGLVFDVVVSPEALPAVLDCVRAVPGTRFVLDHAGKPPLAGAPTGALDVGPMAAWAADVTALADCPNVAVKLSGLVTEADWCTWTPGQLAPAVAHVVKAFGPDRVMFGSDWPVCLLAADYRRVRETMLSMVPALGADAGDAIWVGSAQAWYRLDRS